jgi:hypothetical protein
MNDEQLVANLKTISEIANNRAKEKQAVLDRLGITAVEAALLIG